MAPLFFSQHLSEKLDDLRRAPLSVIEGPAGYGKTTAVHRALDGTDSDVFWYTAVKETADSSFSWFVHHLEDADTDAPAKLRSLGSLNRSNARAAAEIIRDIRTEREIYLVIDNFQYVLEGWQPQIIDSLAKRPHDGLHVILITQDLGRHRRITDALESSVCRINAADFLLNENDIRDFAAAAGLHPASEEISRIFRKTDGWAAAVSVYLEKAASGGRPDNDDNSSRLILSPMWTDLSPLHRELLLRLCLFERADTGMLAEMLEGSPMTPDEAAALLRRTPLIRYQKSSDSYYPHQILLGFLREQLDAQDPALRSAVYSCAGRLYRSQGLSRPAVDCFFRAGDFAGILSCDLTCLITENFSGTSYAGIAARVLSDCPEETQKKYPLSLLQLCYALFADCDFDSFHRHMDRIRIIIDKKNDPQLTGEWYLMRALSFFPDTEGMRRMYIEAEKLMQGPSGIFVKEEPFMFGCTSMWYLFYSGAGAMMETADTLAETMAVYNRLTGGHGAGAAELYLGEALSVQGRFEESDITAYRAAMLAEQVGNITVIYGSSLLLGINAIYRGDMTGLGKAVDYLETKSSSCAFMQGRSLNRHMVEIVRGYLLGLMMETSRSPLWTRGGSDTLSDLTFTNFMIKTCRITDLLLNKEYKKAIASIELSLDMDSRLISVAARNFMYCGLALCYLAVGRIFKAADYLEKSLELAGQDHNYSFLACFRRYFQVLFVMPRFSKYSNVIKEIKSLDINYTRADESRIFSMLEEADGSFAGLTDRELEIARLAARGLRNSEIASQLSISENTVKYHLKNIFSKTSIDRRSKLIEMLR